jgi:hypothetical protein
VALHLDNRSPMPLATDLQPADSAKAANPQPASAKPGPVPAPDGQPAKGSLNAVRLARATPVSSESFWETLGRAASVAAPDALIYTNAPLLAPANAKSFALINPLTRSLTQFISHPQDKVTVGGVQLNRVEAVHYDLKGGGTRREDGFGFNVTRGAGVSKVTFFVNARGGDSNLISSKNGISANVGLFGSPAALRQLVDKLPAGGRTGALRSVLEKIIGAGSIGGSQIGAAWRSTLQLNSKTGVLELDVSGLKIPMGDFLQSMKEAADVVPLNHGDKPVARTNNEDAYLIGANPFQRAADTRQSDGKAVNHGDPVAAISGDILKLAQSLTPNDAPIRTNDQAKRFLEYAIERRTWISPQLAKDFAGADGATNATGVKVDPHPMSAADKTQLSGVLLQLGRYGIDFGSRKIAQASAEALVGAPGGRPATGDTRKFVREVFQGTYRREAAQSYSGTDLARDVIVGANRFAGPLADLLLSPEATARDEDQIAMGRNLAKGLGQRMALEGGAVRAFGLSLPAAKSAPETEAKALSILEGLLGARLSKKAMKNSAEAQYGEFKSLGPDARRAMGRQIQAGLDAWGRGASANAGGPVIDGIPIQGQPALIESVGGLDRKGAARQGDLMWGHRQVGGTMFWLAGRGTNYALRDAQGGLIADHAGARQRAKELIAHGGATDLRPLDAKFLKSDTHATAGIRVRGTASHLKWVGGADDKGQPVQGELVFTRDTRGNVVFMLKGQTATRVLRDGAGVPVRNQVQAEERALQLIEFGGMRGLFPLKPEYLR